MAPPQTQHRRLAGLDRVAGHLLYLAKQGGMQAAAAHPEGEIAKSLCAVVAATRDLRPDPGPRPEGTMLRAGCGPQRDAEIASSLAFVGRTIDQAAGGRIEGHDLLLVGDLQPSPTQTWMFHEVATDAVALISQTI